jgi:predicted kinase
VYYPGRATIRPNAGKTTFREQYYPKYYCICRDDIRILLHGGKYVFDVKKEKMVTNQVNHMAREIINKGLDVIVDQTNCKRANLMAMVDTFKDSHDITIYVFSEPLWKLYIRNVLRYLHTGKFIPFKVIRNMSENLAHMNWSGLLQYIKNK